MNDLAQCIENIKAVVNSIDESIFEKHFKVPLNCADLPLLSPGNESQCITSLADFFNALNIVKQPVIYWFVITSSHSSKQIMNKVRAASDKINRRFPMLERKRTYKYESNVLYVGKTWSKLKGRMVSHLGYHKNIDNHGLQLCHWAQELELELELNYIILPEEVEGLTELFERELSKKLKPIIGREV